ncbi:MAG: META domain-containing protein [Hyphomicrobiaceae bacterium]|nr:META domain-containing protein [Hyphomicrobiaceae bacterium]
MSLMLPSTIALAADTLGGTWTVRTIGGAAVDGTVSSTVVFDGAGHARGTTGCNRYRTAVTTSDKLVSFGPLATTRMACPEPQMARERAFTQAISNVAAFRRTAGELMLYDQTGRELMVLVPGG